MDFTLITYVGPIDTLSILWIVSESKNLYFSEFQDKHLLGEAVGFLRQSINYPVDGPTKEPEEGFDSQKFTFKSPAEDPSGLFPSSEDWENILSGTRQAKYQKGEIVLHQEQETPHLLYQISNGRCVVEKYMPNGTTLVLATLGQGTIFGEMGFIEGPGSKATATVRADEDTTIQVMEGYFLDIMFDYFPGLSGRFFHHLSHIVFDRLKLRELQTPSVKVEKDDAASSDEENIGPLMTISPRSGSSSGSISIQKPAKKVKPRVRSADKVLLNSASSDKLFLIAEKDPHGRDSARDKDTVDKDVKDTKRDRDAKS